MPVNLGQVLTESLISQSGVSASRVGQLVVEAMVVLPPSPTRVGQQVVEVVGSIPPAPTRVGQLVVEVAALVSQLCFRVCWVGVAGAAGYLVKILPPSCTGAPLATYDVGAGVGTVCVDVPFPDVPVFCVSVQAVSADSSCSSPEVFLSFTTTTSTTSTSTSTSTTTSTSTSTSTTTSHTTSTSTTSTSTTTWTTTTGPQNCTDYCLSSNPAQSIGGWSVDPAVDFGDNLTAYTFEFSYQVLGVATAPLYLIDAALVDQSSGHSLEVILLLEPDLRFRIIVHDTSSFNVLDYIFVPDQAKHHVAVVRDGDYAYLWLDGILAAQTFSPFAAGDFADSTLYWDIATRNAGQRTRLNEFRFSKVARYLAPFITPSYHTNDASTNALSHFDEGSGSVIGEVAFRYSGNLSGPGTDTLWDFWDERCFDVCRFVPVVLDDTLPDAEKGKAYSGSVIATGGSAPYTYTLVAGSLPPGLSLSTSGAITGVVL